MLDSKLLLQLQNLRPLLQVNGCVQSRRYANGSVGYRLRYKAEDQERGCRRHRALKLGNDPVIAAAVKEMIRAWKKEYLAQTKGPRQAAEAARRRRWLQELEHREETHLLLTMTPSDQRWRVAREYRAMLKLGDIPAALYVLSKAYLRPIGGIGLKAGTKSRAEAVASVLMHPDAKQRGCRVARSSSTQLPDLIANECRSEASKLRGMAPA